MKGQSKADSGDYDKIVVGLVILLLDSCQT